MQLRYGFNEIDAWWHISLGEHRESIRKHLRRMGTQVVRIFVFDKPVPDPLRDWRHFAAYVQAVLDAGALPMITFAKFHPPYDARNRRIFSARCAEIVWGCLEQWGGDRVRVPAQDMTKQQFFQELNKRGLQMKNMQESTTGPEVDFEALAAAEAAKAAALRVIVKPEHFTLREAELFHVYDAVLRRYGRPGQAWAATCAWKANG